MDCKAFRTEFEELETGEPLSATAQAHVNACACCRAFQHERLSLGQLIKSLGAVNAPPDFDFRLRARLASAKSTGSNSLSRARFAPGLKAISVAASFALLIAAAVVFRQSQFAPVKAPSVSDNPAVAKGNEGQMQNPVNNSESGNNSVREVVATAQNVEAPGPQSSADDSQAGVTSRQRNKIERLAQAKHSRTAAPLKTERSPVNSNDLTFGGNPPVITPAQPKAANNVVNTDNTASLRIPSQPLKVLLHDRRGAMRSVSLERVIFGSQDFLEGDTRKRPLTSDVEGIW
ncbi:MAG TPA: hypothetical protein VF658_11495 [Pyrinomonadaceae bacterium]|jgi:hypothetical protein